jgi:hypothetical protein
VATGNPPQISAFPWPLTAPPLLPREAGNFLLPAFPGLIVKDSYWRWPERDQAGNAIDFCMRVLGLSFHDAMRQITGQ